jgi:hypothetical protein
MIAARGRAHTPRNNLNPTLTQPFLPARPTRLLFWLEWPVALKRLQGKLNGQNDTSSCGSGSAPRKAAFGSKRRPDSQ